MEFELVRTMYWDRGQSATTTSHRSERKHPADPEEYSSSSWKETGQPSCFIKGNIELHLATRVCLPLGCGSKAGGSASHTPVADRRRWQDGVRCCLREAGYGCPVSFHEELEYSSGSAGCFLSDRWLVVVNELAPVPIHGFCVQADAQPKFESVQSALPKWANSDRYDIQARASGNPTKDQFRLMMQALLADRFKLAIHYEIQQLPVFALVLDKPGKLGPKIQPHPSDAPCSTAPLPPGAAQGAIPTVAGGFPEPCGALVGWPSDNPPGRLRLGGRNVPIAMFSTLIDNPATGIDRPVLDKTELDGKFDFIMEFTPQFNGPLPPGATFHARPYRTNVSGGSEGGTRAQTGAADGSCRRHCHRSC